jgi:hypothetical protein
MGVMYVHVTWAWPACLLPYRPSYSILRLGPSAIRCWPSESDDVQPGTAMGEARDVTPLRDSMCLRLASSRVQG